MTEQYGITEEQSIEFLRITRQLKGILVKNQEITNKIKERKKKLYRDARSIRYGELK